MFTHSYVKVQKLEGSLKEDPDGNSPMVSTNTLKQTTYLRFLLHLAWLTCFQKNCKHHFPQKR